MGKAFYLLFHVLWGLALIFLSLSGYSQNRTAIYGKVTDRSTGEAVPYVNVFFYGSQKGTTTDFEGRYSLSSMDVYDSIVFSYIGYKSAVLSYEIGVSQEINVELESETINLNEIVVMSGENPAWYIIRNAVKNKDLHNKRNLQSFEYESYTKIELDIDNITEEVKEEKLFRDVSKVMDSIAVLKGDDGDTYVPVFLSEAISNYYVKNEPLSKREEIIKTKISGIAIQDGSLTSQVIGAFYQEYNFYNNWLKILEKEFISPLADGWKMYYDYDILDTVRIGIDSCYQLLVIPNRKEDPAFSGTIWITKGEFAIKQVDLSISRSSNLNFIEKIKIQQELKKMETGHWLPHKTRVLIDVLQPSYNMPGFIAKFYNSTKNWQINQVHPGSFYENQVVVREDMLSYERDYWGKNRHDSLSAEEIMVYEMIDTLKTIPVVKTYTKIFQTISTGYLNLGKVELGPYLYTWANNNIEGNRFVLGGRTNEYLSRKFYLKGYLAYGSRDEKFKYNARVGLILSRKPWTEFGIQSKYDIEQVGLNSEKLVDNYIFYAATKFNDLIEPYEHRQQKVYFETEITKGLRQRVEFIHNQFDPLYNFRYIEDPESLEPALKSNFNSSSIKFITHWGRDETYLQNGNYRINLGARKAPVFDVSYAYGFEGLLDSDLDFHRFEFQMNHHLKLGLAGTSRYQINMGYILGQVPYPALENHVGNESYFYTTAAFNTMHYSEFVSDQFVSFKYSHSFQGLILNKIPLVRKLKWRLLGSANVLFGSLRDENRVIIPEFDENGNAVRQFNTLDDKPFVELGYGVENIFKVIRVDFFHRLTYLDLTDVRRFQVKISMQLIL